MGGSIIQSTPSSNPEQNATATGPPDAGPEWSAPPDPLELVERGMSLYQEKRLDELRELVHPEAEIQMALLHGDVARGPDGLAAALEAAPHVHSPRVHRYERIDEHAVMLVGRVRFPLDGGGFGDRPAVWLNVLRDGLMWRVRVFSSVDEARRAYEETFRPQLELS